jgi:hypothetical protein
MSMRIKMSGLRYDQWAEQLFRIFSNISNRLFTYYNIFGEKWVVKIAHLGRHFWLFSWIIGTC